MRRALFVFSLVGLCGCSDDLFGIISGRHKLSDEDAYAYLSVNHEAAADPETGAHLAAIAAGAEGGGMDALDQAARLALRRTVFSRLNYDAKAFELVDFTSFMKKPGPPRPGRTQQSALCTWDLDTSKLKASYEVPALSHLPVRDQGRRGTCAAFAGTGAMEVATLLASPQLPTADLSEQRFYYSSKPECQSGGCPSTKEGSWYGNGFDASAMAADLDVPLETDCVYNPRRTDNDVQAPQPASCATGAVKVKSLGMWCGINQLVDVLHEGNAVPWASKLDDAWCGDNPLVTKAEADDTPLNGQCEPHSSGHAYLIVGYRKLPNMPEEGGVCFLIRNSWGNGWGEGGLKCMTLAWMQERALYTDFIADAQPYVREVTVRMDLQGNKLPPDGMGGGTPDPPPEPGPDDGSADVLDPDAPDIDPDRGEMHPPGPDVPEPPREKFSPADLHGPDESLYRVLVAEDGGTVFVKGVLREGDGTATSLAVQLRPSGTGDLLFKGELVGHRQGTRISLCTREFEVLCGLRYRTSDRALYVQFRDDDMRRVGAEEVSADRGQWLDLPLGAKSYGIFVPKKLGADFLRNPKSYVRAGGSEPQRLSLGQGGSATSFAMKLYGRTLGELDMAHPTDASLCSGPYAGACALVEEGQGLFVLPSRRKP